MITAMGYQLRLIMTEGEEHDRWDVYRLFNGDETVTLVLEDDGEKEPYGSVCRRASDLFRDKGLFVRQTLEPVSLPTGDRQHTEQYVDFWVPHNGNPFREVIALP